MACSGVRHEAFLELGDAAPMLNHTYNQGEKLQIEAQSEGEILNPIPILLRIACFPDEHQVLDDLTKGTSAAK